MKLSALSKELQAVERALDIIPEEYKKGVWEFIVFRKPFPLNAYPDTYKIWKQRYVYKAAVLLGYFDE